METFQKLAQKHPALLKELALNYIENFDFKSGQKVLKKYLKKFPNDVSGLMVKGMLEEKLAHYDQAENTYRQVLEFNPNHIRALHRLIYLESLKSEPSDYWKKVLFTVDPLSPVVADLLQSRVKIEPIAIISPPPEEKPQEETKFDFEEFETKIKPQIEKSEALASELEKSAAVSQEEIKPSSDETKAADQDFLKALAKQFDLNKVETEELEIILKEEEEGKGISEKKSLLPEKEQIISASTPDVSALEIKDEIEVQELKSEEENISVSPTSAEEIEELRKVYREINLEAEKIPSSQRKKGAIYTATIAELYVKQNNISRALEIYNAMPEEERSKKLPRIQELQSKLQDIQSENSSKQNNFRTENGK